MVGGLASGSECAKMNARGTGSWLSIHAVTMRQKAEWYRLARWKLWKFNDLQFVGVDLGGMTKTDDIWWSPLR